MAARGLAVWVTSSWFAVDLGSYAIQAAHVHLLGYVGDSIMSDIFG